MKNEKPQYFDYSIVTLDCFIFILLAAVTTIIPSLNRFGWPIHLQLAVSGYSFPCDIWA